MDGAEGLKLRRVNCRTNSVTVFNGHIEDMPDCMNGAPAGIRLQSAMFHWMLGSICSENCRRGCQCRFVVSEQIWIENKSLL